MTKTLAKRENIAKEILSTEKSYVDSLKVLIDVNIFLIWKKQVIDEVNI